MGKISHFSLFCSTSKITKKRIFLLPMSGSHLSLYPILYLFCLMEWGCSQIFLTFSHMCWCLCQIPFCPAIVAFHWQAPVLEAARAQGATGPGCSLDLFSVLHYWLLKSLVGPQTVVSWPWGLRFKLLLTAQLQNLWIPFSCCCSVCWAIRRGAGNVLLLLNLIRVLCCCSFTCCHDFDLCYLIDKGYSCSWKSAYFQGRLW